MFQSSFLSNYILLLPIYSSPQYQIVCNTVWTAEFPGGCVPWCAYIANSLIWWSEIQCKKKATEKIGLQLPFQELTKEKPLTSITTILDSK